jgi:hypothetical protein
LSFAVIVQWARKLSGGPYGFALGITACVPIIIVGLVAGLKIHIGSVKRQAIEVCEAQERADRLALEKQLILKAQADGERALAERSRDLDAAGMRIADLEQQLKDARDALDALPDAGDVVFPADDPWLRKRGAAARSPGR